MKSDHALSFWGSIRRILNAKVSLGFFFMICLLFVVFVWGVVNYSFLVVGEVRVIGVGVGVYWDNNCDNAILSLSWGKIVVNPLRVSESKSITVYVRNEGTRPITLFLNTSDWNPPFFSKYISLSWDYRGYFLVSGDVVKVNLILSINSSIWFESVRLQDYSFNIVISASGL